MKANAIIHDLIKKVLGREEQFSLSLRRGSGTLRFARDSTMYLVPPIEVLVHLLSYYDTCGKTLLQYAIGQTNGRVSV
jgi:hypothetical protein